jgi:3-hydroxy-3-methylglutaryl CoA synthase
MKNAGILGIGTYVPERKMTNFDFEQIMDTTDEWIKTRTGVEERRFAAPHEATSDLCIEAIKKVLASTNTAIEEIEMILVATCTPDFPIPSTACIVQKKQTGSTQSRSPSKSQMGTFGSNASIIAGKAKSVRTAAQGSQYSIVHQEWKHTPTPSFIL